MSFLQALGRKKAKDETPISSYEPDQEQGHRLESMPQLNGNKFADGEDSKAAPSNIHVAVRVRPLSSREISFSNYETVRVIDSKVVIVLDPNNQFDANDVFRANRNKEKQFGFDIAFEHDVSTATVFENTTKFLIPGVLGGFNSTVFAYGATGAGKTFTMLGNQNAPGIMSLTMGELFNQITAQSQSKDIIVKVSYMEVYNETLRDLLSETENIVDIREDYQKGIVIAGVTEIATDSAQEVMELLRIGSKNRIMEPTAANTVSSRSHAVLQVTVEQKEKNQGAKEETTVSKLSLIDLAGSERASSTNNKGQRMIEGANINRSLLALGNCITLLSDQIEKGVKVIHIPYRDSKLTRLLKDSLGGNCRTVMIANVSPSVISFEDTLNTLKYANRAKSIKTSVSKNVLMSLAAEKPVDQYSNMISGLKNENENLKRILQVNHVERPERNIGRDGVFVPNEGLIKEIKRHFEEEMKTKRKIFDLDIQNDELQEKVLMMQYETDLQNDKVAKDRHQEYLNMQKRIGPQIEELRRDFNQLMARRNQLQNKAQNEKSKDGVIYVSTIFQQNVMIIENMDLQHKERRAENEVRIKDKQIRYLESQLGIKGKPNARGRRPSLTPPPHLEQMNEFSSQGVPPFHKENPTDSLDFLHKLNDLDSSMSVGKGLNSPHQPVYLPHISPKGNYSSPNSRVSKQMVTPVKKIGLKQLSDRLNRGSVRKLTTPHENQYYFNKHEFMVQKAKPFDPLSVLPGKRKYAQQRRIRQKVNYGDRFRSFDAMEDNKEGRNSARSRPSVDRVVPMKRGGSLNDLSDRVVPLVSPQEKKKNLLSQLNKKSKVNGSKPPLTRLQILKPYIQAPGTPKDNQQNLKQKL